MPRVGSGAPERAEATPRTTKVGVGDEAESLSISRSSLLLHYEQCDQATGALKKQLDSKNISYRRSEKYLHEAALMAWAAHTQDVFEQSPRLTATALENLESEGL